MYEDMARGEGGQAAGSSAVFTVYNVLFLWKWAFVTALFRVH